MSDNSTISRRSMLKAAGAAGASLTALAAQARAAKVRAKSPLTFNNDDFYTAGGKFDTEAAKDAYIRLLKYHGYPLFEGLRERLWVSDYGIGEFTRLGLGAICFINDEENSYLSQELYLLPSQMLPEHYHLKTEKCPPKMEGWHVRHGISYVYGEGEPAKKIKAVIPASQKEYVTVTNETISGINELFRVVSDSAKQIESLGVRSEEIGNIIEVINSIADQTNLLALNAAIEAARAGEHGRGFAVVADEVRSLAEKTAQATEEVSTSIKAIQQETRTAVSGMQQGSEVATKGVEMAQRMGEALGKITEKINGVSEIIKMVSHTADDQANASQEISTAVERMNTLTTQLKDSAEEQQSSANGVVREMQEVGEVTKGTVGAASELDQASGDLDSASGNLKRLVEQFRLGKAA